MLVMNMYAAVLQEEQDELNKLREKLKLASLASQQHAKDTKTMEARAAQLAGEVERVKSLLLVRGPLAFSSVCRHVSNLLCNAVDRRRGQPWLTCGRARTSCQREARITAWWTHCPLLAAQCPSCLRRCLVYPAPLTRKMRIMASRLMTCWCVLCATPLAPQW